MKRSSDTDLDRPVAFPVLEAWARDRRVTRADRQKALDLLVLSNAPSAKATAARFESVDKPRDALAVPF